MEKHKQKGRLKTASRGHKLLKDKCDEMIRSFMVLIRKNKALRDEVETEISRALRLFMLSRTQMTAQEILAAVSIKRAAFDFATTTANIMGLHVPKIVIKESADMASTASITTVAHFDKAIAALSKLMLLLIELANVEKTCDMLANEIQKTRRRINALEHILIPQIKETIKYISMKLSENERASQIRLIKVKEMLDEIEAIEEAANLAKQAKAK